MFVCAASRDVPGELRLYFREAVTSAVAAAQTHAFAGLQL